MRISDWSSDVCSSGLSGMRARLSFAASIAPSPDVVIIDEVLAVGDLGFRLKCYAYLNEMVSNAAVVFVSHSLSHVSRLCTAGCVQLGRAPLRERECQYVSLPVDAVSLKKKLQP